MLARRHALRLAGFLLLVGTSAAAQPDEATRTAARALGTSGVEAYQANDFETATDRLEKAYEILRVPTLGLWSGRALVRVGKWVEAAERFAEVASLQVPQGEYDVQKQAQLDAADEFQTLKPKIPMIRVAADGMPLSEVAIDIDGKPVPSSLAAEGRLVNPGQHVIVGLRAGERVRVTLTLREGQRETALLRFGVTPATADTATAEVEPPKPGSPTLRAVGYVSLGVGAVGLTLGTVTGIIALGKKSQIDRNELCRDRVCAPSQDSKVDSYNSMRMASSVGFIAGGVLAATGVVLLITSSGSSKTEAFVSPTSAGLQGSF
jgi:hypothetical protein